MADLMISDFSNALKSILYSFRDVSKQKYISIALFRQPLIEYEVEDYSKEVNYFGSNTFFRVKRKMNDSVFDRCSDRDSSMGKVLEESEF